MPFADLVGQDRAIGALRTALRRGALHHALLLAGPPGVGKGSAARILAQALNCEGSPVGGRAQGQPDEAASERAQEEPGSARRRAEAQPEHPIALGDRLISSIGSALLIALLIWYLMSPKVRAIFQRPGAPQ